MKKRNYKQEYLTYGSTTKAKKDRASRNKVRRALTRTLKSYAEKSGYLSKEKVTISGDDFREGLTAVISVKVMEPQFEGQTKTKLGNSEVMGPVDQLVGEMLNNYF